MTDDEMLSELLDEPEDATWKQDARQNMKSITLVNVVSTLRKSRDNVPLSVATKAVNIYIKRLNSYEVRQDTVKLDDGTLVHVSFPVEGYHRLTVVQKNVYACGTDSLLQEIAKLATTHTTRGPTA